MRLISLTVATALVLLSLDAAADARPITIVAFGDSATSGWLVAKKDAYPAQLQALLRKKGYDVTVENAGVPGDTTAGALRRFDAADRAGNRYRTGRIRHQRSAPACTGRAHAREPRRDRTLFAQARH